MFEVLICMHRHSALMQQTIEIARKTACSGQLPFAAILVRDDRVLVEATNSVLATGDVTRHAVINLASAAQQQFSREDLQNCTIFCNCEPCPMCAGLIYWLGITNVVFGGSTKALQQICGPSIEMPCTEIFHCCHPAVEAIGPVAEEQVAELLMEFWPHPT